MAHREQSAVPKILGIFGTRPEAIKMAPIVRELENQRGRVVSRVCVTAQHRELLDQVLGLFHIRPDYDLDLMRHAQSPAQVAAAVMAKLEPVLSDYRPDWVLVQGDTTTALAAALTSFYAGARVGHVEAGLRTYDKEQPFPEELNRRVVSVIADLHFAPTARARDHLLREGISDKAVILTGNPGVDALQAVAQLPCETEKDPLAGLPGDKRILLVTAHRRENFGGPLRGICAALRDLAETYRDTVHIAFPVHPNPNVRMAVFELLGAIPGISLLPPLDYLPFVHLLKRAHLVLTDSGGVQEEAPSFGKPVLVLRDLTERSEAVEAGSARVVGCEHAVIVQETIRLLEDADTYRKMAQAINPFGDGMAAPRIVSAILRSEGEPASGARAVAALLVSGP
jgi:UDP-N-acetylglucosamine 2-epimerase (non-hydrolysing)